MAPQSCTLSFWLPWFPWQGLSYLSCSSGRLIDESDTILRSSSTARWSVYYYMCTRLAYHSDIASSNWCTTIAWDWLVPLTVLRKLDFLLVYIDLVTEAQTLSAESETWEALAEIEEIIVTATRNRRCFGQQPTLVEVLGEEELNEKANMKPGDIRMLLNETTGIHIQQASATSFNSSVRIQDLSGKSTQLMDQLWFLYQRC